MFYNHVFGTPLKIFWVWETNILGLLFCWIYNTIKLVCHKSCYYTYPRIQKVKTWKSQFWIEHFCSLDDLPPEMEISHQNGHHLRQVTKNWKGFYCWMNCFLIMLRLTIIYCSCKSKHTCVLSSAIDNLPLTSIYIIGFPSTERLYWLLRFYLTSLQL